MTYNYKSFVQPLLFTHLNKQLTNRKETYRKRKKNSTSGESTNILANTPNSLQRRIDELEEKLAANAGSALPKNVKRRNKNWRWKLNKLKKELQDKDTIAKKLLVEVESIVDNRNKKTKTITSNVNELRQKTMDMPVALANAVNRKRKMQETLTTRIKHAENMELLANKTILKRRRVIDGLEKLMQQQKTAKADPNKDTVIVIDCSAIMENADLLANILQYERTTVFLPLMLIQELEGNAKSTDDD